MSSPSPLSAPVSPLSFLAQISSDYPAFSYKPGKKFLFRPRQTIYYVLDSDPSSFPLLLLHELSHALLGHFSYSSGLDRLKKERDAWERTRTLCDLYSVPYNPSFCDAELSTYRNWLHQKTLCPTCSSTCLELSLTSLFCPLCNKIITK